MSNAQANNAFQQANVPPPANSNQQNNQQRRRKKKNNNQQGSANHNDSNSFLRNQGPRPGQAVPRNLSSHQTILKDDPMFGNDLFDENLCGFQPVSMRPKFTVDAGPSFDILDACYATLQAKDPNISKFLPFPLFSYYWNLLVWHRALHVAQANQFRTEYWVSEFLEAMNSHEWHVPKELTLWLHGLGNTPDPNGDTMVFDVYDVPSDAVHHNKQGTFGQYSPATAQTYATMPSPYISAAFIQQSCTPANQVTPAWTLGENVDPAPINNGTDHRYLYTENLLGYYPRKPLRDRAISTLTDLGWGPDSVPSDLRGRMNLSLSSLSYVTQRLQDLSSKHPMSHFKGYDSALGTQAQMPYLSVSSRPNEAHIQRATKREVEHCSRYQTELNLMSNSFVCAYRVERRSYHPEADAFRSASLPIQIVDANGTVQNHPLIPDWNTPFHTGEGATRMNHLYFRGSTSYRNDALVKISAKIK